MAAIIIRRVISQPADGSDFTVAIPTPQVNDSYGITADVIKGNIACKFKTPDDLPTDRTISQFRCVTSLALADGDVVEFMVVSTAAADPENSVDAMRDYGALGIEFQTTGSMLSGSHVLTFTGAVPPGITVGTGLGVSGAGPTDSISLHWFPAPTLRARVTMVNGNQVTLDAAAAVNVTDVTVYVDDSKPIQAALDDVFARSAADNPGVVFMRGNVHVIGSPGAKDNQPLFIGSYVTLTGRGQNATTLKVCKQAAMIPYGFRTDERNGGSETTAFQFPHHSAINNRKCKYWNNGQYITSGQLASNPPDVNCGYSDMTIDGQVDFQYGVMRSNNSGTTPGVAGHVMPDPRAFGQVDVVSLVGSPPSDPLKNGHTYYVAMTYLDANGKETSDGPAWASGTIPGSGNYQLNYTCRTPPAGAVNARLYVIDFADANFGSGNGWIWDNPTTGLGPVDFGWQNLCVWTMTSLGSVPAPSTVLTINHYTKASATPENRPPGGNYTQRNLAGQAATAQYASYIDNVDGFSISRVTIKNFSLDGFTIGAPQWPYAPVAFDEVKNCVFTDVIIDSCGREAFGITGPSRNNTWERVTTSNCDWNFDCEIDALNGPGDQFSCNDNHFYDCNFLSGDILGNSIMATFTTYTAKRWRFVNCVWDRANMPISGGGQTQISFFNCQWKNTYIAAISANGADVRLYFEDCDFYHCGRWHPDVPDENTGDAPTGFIYLSNHGEYDPMHPTAIHFTTAVFNNCTVEQADISVDGSNQVAASVQLGCRLRLHNVTFTKQTQSVNLAITGRDYELEDVDLTTVNLVAGA